MPDSLSLLWDLAGWSVRSAVLAVAVGLILRVCRVRDVSARLTVWTIVLCGALLMPLLSTFAPAVDIPVPKWQVREVPASGPATVHAISFRPTPHPMPAPQPKVNWPSLLTGLWAAIAVAMLGQLAVGIGCGRRLIRTAIPVQVHSASPVYESESVRVPITLGSFTPAILLPPSWHTWEERKLAAVLAHESAHVLRRDPLRQLLASIYRAIFWFHPLAWWLHRQLAELAESASDDAALAATKDEAFYAEVLLNFFASAPRRVQWDAVAMATAGKATKRMERILNRGRKLSRGLSAAAIAAIMVAALPVVYFACSATPVWAFVNSQEPAAPPPPPKPATGIVGGVIGGVPGGVSGGVIGGVPAPPEEALEPPDPPDPPEPPDFNFDDDERFAIVAGDGTDIMGSMSPEDREHIAKLRKELGNSFLWFQRGGEQYIIRDPAVISQLKQAFDEINQQGRLMGEKGRAQAEAARKMAEEVRKQIQPQQAEMQRMAEQLQQYAAGLKAQLGNSEEMKRLEAQLRELQTRMRAKSAAMDFGKLQRDLEQHLRSMQFDLNQSMERAQEMLKRLEDESLRSKKAEKII